MELNLHGNALVAHCAQFGKIRTGNPMRINFQRKHPVDSVVVIMGAISKQCMSKCGGHFIDNYEVARVH